MTELTETQKAGLERLGRKEEKKRFHWDKRMRQAYESGRTDGIFIGMQIPSFIFALTWVVVKLVEYYA